MRQGHVLIHAGFPDQEAADTTWLLLAGIDAPRRIPDPTHFVVVMLLAVVCGILGAALVGAGALALATGVPPRALVIDAGVIGGVAGVITGGWLAHKRWRPTMQPGGLVVTSTTTELEEVLSMIRRHGGSTIEVVKLEP